MRALFHINEQGKWKTTLNAALNASGVCAARGEALELYIVANGDAVNIVPPQVDEVWAQQRERLLEAMKQPGIHVMLCQKAMELRSLTLPDDFEDAQVVPSAALFLIEHQELGFPYIKQ